MSDNSKIEWTEASWNPVTGCVKVSPGCDNCYAETFAERFRGVAGHHFENGFDVTLRPERLDQPLRWKRPRRIFVNSMSDLFHEAVPDAFIARVWAVMAATPQHTYQILTKRHGRMKAFLNDICRCGSGHPPGAHLMSAIQWAATPHNPNYVPGLDHDTVQEAIRGMTWGKVLPNVWLGVSVEDQHWADIRIPALLETRAAVRWISAEPLLGPVDLLPFVSHQCDCPLLPDHLRLSEYGPRLDWVVAGGESGRGARPMHPDWARGLRDACARHGVPFFFKQHGEWEPLGPLYPQGDDDPDPYDDAHMDAVHLEVIEKKEIAELERDGTIAAGYQPGDPRTWLMARVGKKAAGRELDGRTWDEYPGGLLSGVSS